MWLKVWLENVCRRVFAVAFCENRFVVIVFFAACAALLVAAVVGYRAKNTGVYAGLAALAFGVACIAVATQTLTVKAGVLLVSAFLSLGGGAYLVLWLLLTVRERVNARREKRRETERKLQFTLPERENSFVRARLNASLASEEKIDTDAETEAPLPLSYAWALLSRLREKTLSAADRLTVTELASLVSAYREKKSLSLNDQRALNDALAGILKMSAKYSA